MTPSRGPSLSYKHKDSTYEVAATDSGGHVFWGRAFAPLRCALLFSFPFSVTPVSANAPPRPSFCKLFLGRAAPPPSTSGSPCPAQVDTPQACPLLCAVPVSRSPCRVPCPRASGNLAWRHAQTGLGLPATAPTGSRLSQRAPGDDAEAQTSGPLRTRTSHAAQARQREPHGDESHRSRPAGGQSPWSGRRLVTAAREAAGAEPTAEGGRTLGSDSLAHRSPQTRRRWTCDPLLLAGGHRRRRYHGNQTHRLNDVSSRCFLTKINGEQTPSPLSQGGGGEAGSVYERRPCPHYPPRPGAPTYLQEPATEGPTRPGCTPPLPLVPDGATPAGPLAT